MQLDQDNGFFGYPTDSIAMITDPTLRAESVKVASFFLDNYAPAEQWEDPLGYSAWYISHGYLAMVLKEDGEILGVATARPVSDPSHGACAYAHDDRGSCIFVDCLVKKKGYNFSLAMLGFSMLLRQRFGPRETVAYFRRNEERMRVHDWRTFIRNLDRSKERILHEQSVCA